MILANKYQTQLREVIEFEDVTDESKIEQLKKTRLERGCM